MKKSIHGLLLLTIILCAAAAALMVLSLKLQNSPAYHHAQGNTGEKSDEKESSAAQNTNKEAPAVPSGSEGTVRAYFLSASEYESLLSGKEKYDFDASEISLEGKRVPYDKKSNTVYIPQSIEDREWDDALLTSVPGAQICILNDSPDLKQAVIEDGQSFRMAVVSDHKYAECSLLFTGLPAVCMNNRDGVIEGEEYKGTVTVLDPYRKEYQNSDCTFHVRGATSLIFDKKSYRVELLQTEGNSDKKSFLGMRSDDDWILNSFCTDRSLSREKICYDLWKELNTMEERPVASSEIEYCELFINDAYMGVYGLMYPVDKKLMDMRPGDLLYKVGTWYEEISIPGELTDYNGKTEILNRNGVAYLTLKYPKEEGKDCIYDPFQLYQEMVFVTGDMSEMNESGIRLNLSNFILHELFCEMARAGDNTWKNMFIAAYADKQGGYTLNETIWDLNYTFGDDFTWDPDNGNTKFNPATSDSYKIRYDRDYGYTRLAQIIDGLREDTAVKWREWRTRGISPEFIKSMFEENRSYLIRTGALKRNALKWYQGDQDPSYSQIYDWIDRRFVFLDKMYGYSAEE